MSNSNIEQTKENYDVADFVAAEAELRELKEKYNLVEEEKKSLWKKIGDKYAAYKENQKPVVVSKKKYCLMALFLGWLGAHRFMIGRKGTGLLYLITSWTGLSFALSVLDIFQAAFLEVDENNLITLP